MSVGYSATVTWLSMLLAIAALILVAINYHHQANLVAPDPLPCAALNVTVNGTCDDGRVLNANCTPPGAPCTLGYLLPDFDSCVHAEAPTGTACSDVCYIPDAVTTVCSNDTGACVGDPAESLGSCQVASDCNVSLPFNDYWLGVNYTDGFVSIPIFWNYACDCYWNRAMLFVLELFWQPYSTLDHGGAVGALSRCSDYLDLDFYAQRGQCLDVSFYILDLNLTNPVHYLNQTDLPPQFGLCVYSYKNSALNQTAIDAGKKRALPLDEDDHMAYFHQVARELIAARQSI